MFLTMQGFRRRMDLHRIVNCDLTEAGFAAKHDSVKFSGATIGTIEEWFEWEGASWSDQEGQEGIEIRFLAHATLNGRYNCRLFLSRDDILSLFMKAFFGGSVQDLFQRVTRLYPRRTKSAARR